jgi:hypothetical protein
MSEEQMFLPWGIPDPAFWHGGPGSDAAGPHGRAPQQQKAHNPPPITRPPADAPHRAYQSRPPQKPMVDTPAPAPSSPPGGTPPADDGDGTLHQALGAHMSAIEQAISESRLMDATIMAAHADETMTLAYGPTDSGTINVRQMRGYIASQAGDNVTATRWFVATAQLWMRTVGSGDPLTQNAAGWAAASWHRIAEAGQARALAPELLETLTTVSGPDSDLVKGVRSGLSTGEDSR